tara:strand:+ start:1413 stop:1763 length:351 start_codon:yes stop_codon:yes gene_type:complete
MKLHHTKYKKNYKNLILGSLNDVDGMNREQKIKHLSNRIDSEYGHLVKRLGRQKAISEWLSGLAINIPFYNQDILQLAKDMGSVDNELTERQEERIIENYWDFMAMMVLELEKEVV